MGIKIDLFDWFISANIYNNDNLNDLTYLSIHCWLVCGGQVEYVKCFLFHNLITFQIER